MFLVIVVMVMMTVALADHPTPISDLCAGEHAAFDEATADRKAARTAYYSNPTQAALKSLYKAYANYANAYRNLHACGAPDPDG